MAEQASSRTKEQHLRCGDRNAGRARGREDEQASMALAAASGQVDMTDRLEMVLGDLDAIRSIAWVWLRAVAPAMVC